MRPWVAAGLCIFILLVRSEAKEVKELSRQYKLMEIGEHPTVNRVKANLNEIVVLNSQYSEAQSRLREILLYVNSIEEFPIASGHQFARAGFWCQVNYEIGFRAFVYVPPGEHYLMYYADQVDFKEPGVLAYHAYPKVRRVRNKFPPKKRMRLQGGEVYEFVFTIGPEPSRKQLAQTWETAVDFPRVASLALFDKQRSPICDHAVSIANSARYATIPARNLIGPHGHDNFDPFLRLPNEIVWRGLGIDWTLEDVFPVFPEHDFGLHWEDSPNEDRALRVRIEIESAGPLQVRPIPFAALMSHFYRLSTKSLKKSVNLIEHLEPYDGSGVFKFDCTLEDLFQKSQK